MSISSIFAVNDYIDHHRVIGVIAINIQDMTMNVESSLTIHVQMEREATQEEVDATYAALQNLEHVASVTIRIRKASFKSLLMGWAKMARSLRNIRAKIIL